MFSRAVKGEDGQGRCLAPSRHSHSPVGPPQPVSAAHLS